MSYFGVPLRNGVVLGVGSALSLRNSALQSGASLVLDFSLGVLSPAVTFTRSTTATYTDSSGLIASAAIDTPRFDYDPVTLAPKGLLIEEQRTNLLTYSEQFDDAVWFKEAASISANTITAPSGALTADKLIENSANAIHFIRYQLALAASTTYTVSVYAKAGERTRFQISGSGLSWTSYSTAIFDLSAGTVVTNTGAFTSASITPVGGGWFRCTATGISNASSTIQQAVQLVLVQSGTTISYTGDGSSGVYLWGAQLEAGAFATSYIPTVASQATRAADFASITGTNFSSWYNASEGTIYSESVAPLLNGSNSVYSISNGTVSNRIASAFGTFTLFVQVGGATQASLGSNLGVAGTYAKYAGAYKVNNFAFSINGTTALTDTAGSVPTNNVLYIGSSASGNSSFLNGTIKKIVYYPRRLSNAELQVLTS